MNFIYLYVQYYCMTFYGIDEVGDGLFVTSGFFVFDMSDEVASEYDEIVSLMYVEDDSGVPDVSTTGSEFGIRDNGFHDEDAFQSVVEYVVDSLECGDDVLVHCVMGMNRSVGVASAALAIHEGISADDALDRVISRRSGACPVEEIVDSVEIVVSEWD